MHRVSLLYEKNENDAPSNSLMNSIVSPKGENNGRIGNWGMLPNLQHIGGRKVLELWDED